MAALDAMQGNQNIKHLQAARACLSREKYGEALAHFVFLANVEPALKKNFELDFVIALFKWTEMLEAHGKLNKIMTCFQQAIQLYPDNETLLNNIGASLFKLGFTDEAASFFRKSLQLNPLNVRAKENLESVANVLVERWHFRMLNDKQRNMAYRNAITRAVAQGYDTVLDIGSGTGILSMFAVQASAKEVYACELSKTMYELSQDVLRANHMQDSIQLIHKKSTDIVVGQDIPRRVSLIVTETLDCGLLGEGILKTIAHAWDNLLVSNSNEKVQGIDSSTESINGTNLSHHKCPSKVIPRGAVLYGTVIESKDIRGQSRCKATLSGFDVTSVEIIGGEKLDETTQVLGLDQVEPYTTECLDSLQGGFKALTETFIVTQYDFCDPKTLTEEGKLSFSIPVTCSGNVDAIAGWFDLHLDEQTHISTGPGGKSLCWEQAVFPVYLHHLPNLNQEIKEGEKLISVTEGDIIMIEGKFSQEYLNLQCSDIKKASTSVERKYPVTAASFIPMFTDEEMVEDKSTDTCVANTPSCSTDTQLLASNQAILGFSPVVRYSKADVAIIPPPYMLRANDNIYNTACRNSVLRAVKEILDRGGNAIEGMNNIIGCKMIDLSHSTSLHLTALAAARAGAGYILLPNSDDHSNVIEEIRKVNGIANTTKYGTMKLEQAAVDDKTWDLLYTDVVEPSGVLQQQVIEDIVFTRGCLLKQGSGIIIPESMRLFSMCIDSQSLIDIAKVTSRENTLGFEVGRFMNAFQVSTHVNIDLRTLMFTPLSAAFELFEMNFMKNCQSAEDILSLLETNVQHKIKILTDGTIHALPYWFSIDLDSSESLVTYGGGYSESHWRQAVIILKDTLQVKAGDEVLVTAILKHSCISITVHK